VALFVKTYTKVLSNLKKFEPKESIVQAYRQRFADIISKWGDSQEETKEAAMSGDEQILL